MQNLSTSDAFPPLRIFVVENDPETLKYFRMYLETLGHEVLHARGVADAVTNVPGSGCDVLISDISLHDGTGWDLLRHLRETDATCPPYAIAMSGFGMNSDRARSTSAGFRHHLLKPFEPDELDAMLLEAAQERSERLAV